MPDVIGAMWNFLRRLFGFHTTGETTMTTVSVVIGKLRTALAKAMAKIDRLQARVNEVEAMLRDLAIDGDVVAEADAEADAALAVLDEFDPSGNG